MSGMPCCPVHALLNGGVLGIGVGAGAAQEQAANRLFHSF